MSSATRGAISSPGIAAGELQVRELSRAVQANGIYAVNMKGRMRNDEPSGTRARLAMLRRSGWSE